MQRSHGTILPLIWPILLGAFAAGPAIANEVKFLTGPKKGEALELAQSYFANHRATFGLSADDVAELVLRDHYRTEDIGTTHLYWRQFLGGVEVWQGDLHINVARDGSIINLNNDLVANLAAKINSRSPQLSAESAIQHAADHLGVIIRQLPQTLEIEGGPAVKARFSGGSLSRDEIPARLVYVKTEDGNVRLAWHLVIRRFETSDWWEMMIDAATGAELTKVNWVAHAGPHSDHEEIAGGPADSYRVFPFPFENPDETTHNLVVSPANSASPFGWHDTNGDLTPEFLDTRGNNVFAQDDIDANNSGGSRPTGTGAGPLTFDFAFNPADQPNGGTNLNAAIVNLFYWNNVMHDVTHLYGFNEVAGNFQENNYGNGGAQGDPVQADAQDGSALPSPSSDNANFGTPPDGVDPRMQMFWFRAPGELVVNAPVGIAGTYVGPAASFGALMTLTGTTGAVVLVNDGVGTTSDGCEALAGLAGQIALIDRGGCEFGVKVRNAQLAGAIGAIVVQNVADPPINMGPGAVGNTVTIPAVMISQADGNTIKAQLPAPGVNATLRSTIPHRDSDNDAGIIAHEFGHGISNRLTGGPANSSCLNNITTSEQAGEGWSDFWTLVLFAEPGDQGTDARGVGNYSQFETESGGGIRNFPYSTDPMISPQTYSDVATTNVPHGVGEIWAGALWNLYWELVTRYGTGDLYTSTTGGNNRLIFLVLDGMKLQPCNPTHVQARDAILLADQNRYGGANRCAIWRSFGVRGYGLNALGGTINRGDETEDFTIPPECVAALFSDGFESGNTSAWSATVP